MPKPKAVKKVVKRKGTNGYVMPSPIPLGTVLTDISKKKWKIGPSIGTGGFGEIYSACLAESSIKKTDDYPYVVKIEPHQNGPLFVEMHFYMRNAKLDDIESFKKSKGLKALGMPHYVGSGSEEIDGLKHRFIVMPRYGKDIWSMFLKNGRKFPMHTIYRLGIQMLDVYEYIHNSTYVHADLKGANILLGFGKNGNSQAYLVDFGLASHYTTKDYKPDPKKMHNGTIEYTSRDAHEGVPTMRGDIEILAYNLIQWCGNQLPWEAEKLLANPAKVQQSKEIHMSDTKKLIKDVPPPIKNFVKCAAEMSYDDKPEYEKLRKLFEKGLKDLGKTNSGDLEFDLKKSSVTPKNVKMVAEPSARKSPRRKRQSSEVDSSSPEATVVKKSKRNIVQDREESDIEEVEAEEKPKKNKETKKTSVKLSSNTESESVKLKHEKAKKTYEFNFELDVSFDADVIVNVHRANKKKKSKKESSEDEKENGEEEDEIIQASVENTPEPKRRAGRKRVESPVAEPKAKNKGTVPVAVARAGEYKGRKAKC